MKNPIDTKMDLNSPFALKSNQAEQFRTEGFIVLRNVFTETEICAYRNEILGLTHEHNKYKDVPLEKRGTYGKAFVQVTNLWRMSDIARRFSFNRRLARIATELMGTRGVRMWHDQALYKEPSGGITPWHVDQQYWPMESEKSVTAWIPMQDTPMEMGPLQFARGSHTLDLGREMEISDESEHALQRAVQQNQLEVWNEPYQSGDVSFHYGWTLHRAGANTTDKPRAVHTVIYMDRAMRLKDESDITKTQRTDWKAFTPTTKPGHEMKDDLNPVLYELE